ncbi:hypothetical protein KI387_009445, partial [Taxus chinensis]
MDANYGMLNNPLLEITVHGCSKLKNMNYFTKQQPYVCLDYVGTQFRTTTHKEGGKNPSYNEKYYFRVIEDVDQLDIRVYSKNSMASDTLIGSGRAYRHRVVCMGYDETAWPIVDKHNKFSGEVKLSMVIVLAEAQIVASAPPLVSDNYGEGRVENVLSNMVGVGSTTMEKLVEKIALFLFTKALE